MDDVKRVAALVFIILLVLAIWLVPPIVKALEGGLP